MKATIAIPNFNGSQLLRNNLPSILDSGVDEVLVVDDGSSDNSLEMIKKEFPQVRLLENKVNLGFIPSVNTLFNHAKGDIVILLNSDVSVEPGFTKSLIPHFKKNSVFAVNCHEEGQGWAKALWKDGFYEYERGSENKTVHKSAWASGGSAAFRRETWQKLGGFDQIFARFYWEDIDLSFRAIKAGYDVLWEPQSKVYHQHEATIGRMFKRRYVSWVQQRNQLLFIWKNIYDLKLINEHRWYLAKRLIDGFGVGYWIPFIWALSRRTKIRSSDLKKVRSDQEAIDYAGG